MFDLSWTEIILVIGVGLFVLKPEDLREILKFFRKAKKTIANLSKEVSNAINEIDGIKETKDEINNLRTIIDLDGNPQEAYDVAEARALVEQAKTFSANPEQASVQSLPPKLKEDR